MKDEFVSVEHIMLAVHRQTECITQNVYLRNIHLKKTNFMNVLAAVRGNTRVTTDTPEDTYDALEKYAANLVEMAKKQQTRSGHRRDDEIRNVIPVSYPERPKTILF